MGSYGGISNYVKKRKINKELWIKIICILVAISTFGISFAIAASKYKIKDVPKIEIKSEYIKEYIIISEEISKGKTIINWQELASINSVLNNGDFAVKDRNNLKSIGQMFYKDNKIKDFKTVLADLQFSGDQRDRANQVLEGIKGNVLNSQLKDDKNKEKFIKDIEELAIENYNSYGILPSITISQAILESGWGQSQLATEHKNLFGIKADKRWSGATAKLETKENYDDVIEAFFRKYDNVENSVEDHGKFLSENNRYKENGVFKSKNYMEQAKALQDAGYSTSKDEEGNLTYANKLLGVIRENNLMLYDVKANRE